MTQGSGQGGTGDNYNRAGLLAFVFSMTFVLCFFFYLVAIHPGVNLNEKVVDPHAVKSDSAQTVVAFDMDKVSEPWISKPEIVAYGEKVFKSNCAMCHGDSGKGDGPAGGALKPPPRNLVKGEWTQGAGIISHYKVIQNGIPGGSMASFKHLKSTDRWAIVHFIESITENKSKDTAAQVAEFAKSEK